MFSYWAYILVGNNNTGKTSFQRHLAHELCGQNYAAKLPSNTRNNITLGRVPRDVKDLFMMGRSYQEKIPTYGTVQDFFDNYFQEASICILSSHTEKPSLAHIQDMIRELRLRAYNVAAVFFENGYNAEAKKISLLDWDERLWVDNPTLQDPDAIKAQLGSAATKFTNFLVARAAIQ